MDYIKAEQVGKNKWRVLSIPFGGPLTNEAVAKLGIKREPNPLGFDMDGEFFSINTDIKPDWFDRRPLVWHHNLDKTMEDDAVIGTDDDLELDEKTGWWSTLWLDRSHRYFAEIDKLLTSGKIYGSSGTLPTFHRMDAKTGEIKVWPFIEQTLTPTPANPLSRTVSAMKAVKHFDEANIGLNPALRGILTDLDSPEADLRPDLETAADAATQRLAMDPDRERVIRELTALVPKLEQLKAR